MHPFMNQEIATMHARDLRAQAERSRRTAAVEVAHIIDGWRPREAGITFGWRARSARALFGVAAKLIGACADELWSIAQRDAVRAR